MPEFIQLLTIENTSNQKKQPSQQKVIFVMQVDKLAYDKQVDVIWAGQDGIWHTLKARYLSSSGQSLEYWQAKLTFNLKTGRALPGAIRFALRCRSQGREYWDNQNGQNYLSIVKPGITLHPSRILQNLNLHDNLSTGQQWLSIKIAVNRAFAIQTLTVYWTTDNWQTIKQHNCRIQKKTLHADTQIWTARLKPGAEFKLQYAICAKSADAEFWDNNAGNNYYVSRQPLKVMILNLHCYQESNQDHKFSQIAKAINDLSVDVVCFQEVAEHWNHGHGDWGSNSANIINQRLKQPFHIHTDWSHLGFDRYREGVAILSRFPLLQRHARYVSDNQDIYSIHSRKVVMAEIAVPYFGNINVFSAHLSWWEDGFKQQFQNLCAWANDLSRAEVATTLLCGDFNITAGSIGYWQVVDSHHYEDQYLAANAQGLFEQIYRVNDPHWRAYPTDDYRIDYIFMNKDSTFKVRSARVLFTDHDYGQVSDHCGYLMTFEPK